MDELFNNLPVGYNNITHTTKITTKDRVEESSWSVVYPTAIPNFTVNKSNVMFNLGDHCCNEQTIDQNILEKICSLIKKNKLFTVGVLVLIFIIVFFVLIYFGISPIDILKTILK